MGLINTIGRVICLISLSSFVIAQCNDGLLIDGFELPQNNAWEVAVQVSELGDNVPGRSLTVSLNGADPLTITSDGVFCFANTTAGAAGYSVQIIDQPSVGNVCTLSENTGIANAPVLVTAACDADPTLWDQFDWNQADWN